MTTNNYSSVTEIGGEWVSKAQIERLYQRYQWAGKRTDSKSVLEVACGSGTGLSYLSNMSASLVAGDISTNLAAIAKNANPSTPLSVFDIEALPFQNSSFDVVIIFEAIYYLNSLDKALAELSRVIRRDGTILIATANKDLADFNPSQYSTRYLNIPELYDVFTRHGYQTRFYGGSPVNNHSASGKIYHLLKGIAAKYKLIPSSMRYKRLLKLLTTGKLVRMPTNFGPSDQLAPEPEPLSNLSPDKIHQVLYCEAKKHRPNENPIF